MHTYTRACCMGGWYGRETRKKNSHKKVTKRAVEKKKTRFDQTEENDRGLATLPRLLLSSRLLRLLPATGG